MDVTRKAGAANAPVPDLVSAGPARPGAASITLEGVGKRYPDGTTAVANLDLRVEAGELTVLIGPSGCGKSTLLRMINRLVEPTTGRILLDEEDVTLVDPVQLRRRIGYVIQDVGLFPHQTVHANVGTVPRLLGWPRAQIRVRSDELLDLVGLDPRRFGKRYPHELSGGQRQRVGVARALAADPVVLLMDEPFSAVDPIVRSRLQDEFLRLQADVRKTIVLVTHDLDEAVRLGDQIAVLSQGGKLEQFSPPATILGAPASPFVHEFVGADRSIRRLAVIPVDRDLMEALPGGETPPGLPAVALGTSCYDALALLLTEKCERARVVDAHGRAVGLITRTRLLTVDAVPAAGS